MNVKKTNKKYKKKVKTLQKKRAKYKKSAAYKARLQGRKDLQKRLLKVSKNIDRMNKEMGFDF